ncbi:MAG: hypothetical protein QXU06_03170 [Candidatus Bathyarchaeia archaeon]
MVMIDAGDLKGERARLIEFLKSKLGGVELSGDLLRLGCGSKEARLYLKKFFHQRSISEEYKVVASKGVLKIVRAREREREGRERRGLPPPPSSSMPYLFPS